MCNQVNIPQLLDQIVPTIIHANNKSYWMVRTDDGTNYPTFSENNIVALNVRNISIGHIQELFRQNNDKKECVQLIKSYLIREHAAGHIRLSYEIANQGYSTNVGRLAGQIYAMAFEMHFGDIVLIPSHGASELKIGKIADADMIIDDALNDQFSIARRVEWLKTISKRKLDPCLYKALGAHQAVSNISDYSEYIERNYHSYFTIDDKMHYVLTVNNDTISAVSLSKFVLGILDTAQDISNTCGLELNMDDVEFTINVNSPGKFSFISTVKASILVIAVATAIGGGTLHYQNLEMSTNGAFSTLVEGINSLLDANENRREQQELFNRYMQSLELKSVEEWSSQLDEAEEEMAIEAIEEAEMPALPANVD